MFSPDEKPGRRKNWGAAYILLALMGLSVVLPLTRPVSLDLGYTITMVWGFLMLLGYGLAACVAFSGNRMIWIENSAVWLGNTGLSIYVIAVVQSVVVEDVLGKTAQAMGYVALLTLLVSRALRMQRWLRQERRLKEIIRIAEKNNGRY